MKEKIKERINENGIIIAFGLLIFIFHLFFVRLFIKTDDGNFLGIVFRPDFTYASWLTERYLTVSGRSVGEFLLTFFLRHNLIFWKIINTVMITYISYFWFKLSKLFGFKTDKTKQQIFCCCGLFLMLVSCLNPSVFWYAGTFSYLWPFAGMLMTVSPLVSYIFDSNVKDIRWLASFFFAFIGTSQEQAAACCTALYIFLLFIAILKKKAIKVSMLIPLVPIAVCDWFLFTAPGAKGRNAMEAGASFPAYAEYNIFQKLGCGFASFFSNSYYLSFFLMIIFVVLLSVAIYERSENSKTKKLLIAANIFTVTACVLVNVIFSAMGKSLAHIIFRTAFNENKFNMSFYALYVTGFLLTALIAAMVVVLMRLDKTVGISTGLCVAAGFCSAIVMSFSPTVFSSGQRVAFYTNAFVITACVILLSSISPSKYAERICKAAVIYGVATFVIDCFAYRLVEHPLMG